MVINFTNKIQYLFQINKGVLIVDANDAISKYVPDSDRCFVTFQNIIYIYIGSRKTDVTATAQ